MGKLVLTDEEKVLASRTADLIQRCTAENIPVFTEFLSDREGAVVLEKANEMGARDSLIAFGGYGDAERTVAGFFPEYFMYMDKEELLREFPIEALKIECSGFREHSHRDFLGSILGLGIDRSVTGDIIVGEKGFHATVFVHKKMSSFIAENLKLVGRDGVKVSVCKAEEIDVCRNFLKISGTAASMRIDALLSEVLNISRDKAVKLVESECVTVGHVTVSDKSKALTEGDIITVRGFGKYRLALIGDLNRKGRTRFEVEKYI
ncbi:MAG: hypothetical protein E7583_06695 [Ruminococcaceae bacterium]|nr:hypothetical protein [Oscillospiraceae bacterium]